MNHATSPVNGGKAKVALDGDTALTLAQKGRGNPFDPANYGEIVKPGELVDIVELSPLTLADRRIYNLLIANAWERIGEPVIHRIPKSALKGTHQGNERIESSLLRLMGTIAIVTIRKGGKSFKRRVQLLGPSDESLEKDGFLHYRIPEELIEILRNSEVYARLKTQVMYCFESKYALCLYEMIERRIGLEYKQSEEFTIAELRGLL
ncbi:MAG: RepB family plasmid replication initiator protein, partial [Sphingobium sp.]